MATFLFDQGGHVVAFRRTPDDKFLWDKHGRWIGWFPWADADAVDKTGKYLGTVVNDRLLRKITPGYRGYPGYPGYPGYAGYPGYPGFAGYSGYVAGYSSVDTDRLSG
jgi:hypothetical protein